VGITVWKTFSFGNMKEGPIKVGLGFGYYHRVWKIEGRSYKGRFGSRLLSRPPRFRGALAFAVFNLRIRTVDSAKEHSRCILGALLQLRP
jgi:hypothetical protein